MFDVLSALFLLQYPLHVYYVDIVICIRTFSDYMVIFRSTYCGPVLERFADLSLSITGVAYRYKRPGILIYINLEIQQKCNLRLLNLNNLFLLY